MKYNEPSKFKALAQRDMTAVEKATKMYHGALLDDYRHVPEIDCLEDKITFLKEIPYSEYDYYVADILSLAYKIIEELQNKCQNQLKEPSSSTLKPTPSSPQ